MKTQLLKLSRTARRKAAKAAKVAAGFAILAASFMLLVAMLSLLFAGIEALAVALGVPSFVLYLGFWLLLWLGTFRISITAPSM